MENKMSWLRRAFWTIATLTLSGCARESWHEIPVVELPGPAAEGAMLPHLAALRPDGLVLSWVEPAGGGQFALKFSTFNKAGWDANPRVVAQGSDWFVNWADFPAVVPIDAMHWSAHWLVKRPGGDYAYDIALSVSADSGASWKPAVTPHLDGTPTEHGFVSRFPVAGGFAIAWLDGRETSASDHATHSATDAGAMTLRAARIGFDGELGQQFLVDSRVCDCCQTAATMTRRGALLAYRDRSEQELRDISVARFENGKWQALAGTKTDGWKINGCPVNGPAIDAIGNNVALAWFTAADNRPRVMLALSRYAGDDFSDPILIEENALGRVDVVALDDGGAVVSWLAQTGQGAEIRLRRVDAGGEMSPIRTVAATQPARSSGFPQLARKGDDLVLAWTVVGDPSNVRTAMLEGAAR